MDEPVKNPRKRQAHWDKLHLKTVSTHLTVEEYDRLKVACRWYGRKPYELVRAYLLEYTASVFRKMDEPVRYGSGSICIDGRWL